MFDNVLNREREPKRRLGAGAVITVLVHAAAVAAFVYLSSRPVEEDVKEAEVKFFSAPPAAPPPPPAPAASSTPTPTVEKKEKRHKKPQEIIQPKEIPQDKPKEVEPEPEPEPEPAAPEPAGVPGGVPGGVEGGVPGGVEGGVPGGVPGGTGTDVLAFGEGMTRPEHIKTPPDFQCPREAREAHVEGVLLASCTVTLDGYLRDCKIVKPLPHMEAVAMDLLQRWRVGPVMFRGARCW